MRKIVWEHKDVTENKITVATSEIRLKIRKRDEENSELIEFMNKCVEYFSDKEFPITVRFRVVGRYYLKVLNGASKKVGFPTNQLHINSVTE